MLIKNAVWRKLSQKEKFDLLLKHSNMNVLGKQVVQQVKKKKTNPYTRGKQA